MSKFVAAAASLAVVAGVAQGETAQPIRDNVHVFNMSEGVQGEPFEFMQDGARNNPIDINGDAVTAGAIGVNVDAGIGAALVGPDSFTFGSAGQSAGTNAATGAPNSIDAVSNPAGSGLVEVAVVHNVDDGSDVLPSGVTVMDAMGNTVELTDLAFQAGESLFTMPIIPPDPLTNAGGANFKVVDAQYFLVDGTGMQTNFDLTGAPFNESGPLGTLDASVLIEDAAGAGINQQGIVWTVQIPTPGATALFGVAGLAAVRRRRS